MAIYHQDIEDIELNGGSLHRSFLNHSIGLGDAAANRFGVRVFRDGVAETLSGVTCQGFFRNANGENIALTSYGTIDGNVAYVTLPQACYNVEGMFTLAIKLVGGGVTGTMRIIDGVVDNTNTGSAVAPTGSVPTYQEVLSVYEQMQAAVTNYDAKVAEQDGKISDLKSAIKPLYSTLMEQGSWGTVDTNHPLRPQDLNYVIRTKDYYPWISGMSVACNDGYQARLLLVGNNYNYIVLNGWAKTVTLTNTTAAYCMVCIKKDDNSALSPDKIADAIAYTDIPLYTIHQKADESNFEALESEVENIKEKASGEYRLISFTTTSGIMDKTGNISNVGQRASISVSEGEKYKIIAYKYSNDYPAYIFRKNGSIVSYSDNASVAYHSWSVTVPANVDEMIVNANSYLLTISKFVETASKPLSNWEGKTIAWFGTSIPEPSSYNPVVGYPEYVAELLGATIYNESVGSSCARRGTRSAESANDPYGVTNMGIGALWSLGGTVAEKTDLTTNWESKWRSIVGYDVAMTDAIKNKAIACSYENKLMQYVTSNPVDLYVFDHGYNDWRATASDNEMNPSDPFDRSTYQGAMNTFISAILTANPHANIVLISHYETQREPGVIDMQESVAEYWNLPLIRICDKLGWAWDRTITSDGYWQTTSGGGIWVESGGTSGSYHLPELHMQDGKHPNTDLSGKACMDIGNIIAAELNMLSPHR